jgi:glycosyltransferase involved in cell wall biosynthesis
MVVCLVKPYISVSKVVVDAHTPNVNLTGTKKLLSEWLNRTIFSLSDLVIVTNGALKEIYEEKYPRGRFFVLPDKIPNLCTPYHAAVHDKIEILLICTYSEDEPFTEVIKAVTDMEHVVLYISGDKRKINKNILLTKPKNVILTGFLKEENYIDLLNKVDIVMALTLVENCMLCGAFEGLSVEKPMILSNKKVLREYFNSGVVFTKNYAEDIRKNIQSVIDNYNKLARDIKLLKTQKSEEWRIQWNSLIKFLD